MERADHPEPSLPRPLPSAAHSLSVRLFLWIFALVLVALGVYTWFTIRTASEHWRDLVYLSANRSSEIIKRSTRHAMLLNRKEDVHEIIDTIAELPGVAGARIYDKLGTIIVSGDSAEIGQRVDMRAEACIICHDQSKPLRSLPIENRARVYRSAEGERVLGLISPIENEPECVRCHVHPADQTVLGVLDVKMSLADADRHLAESVRAMVFTSIFSALLIGVATALFINHVVRLPVRRLIAGARRIAGGDLVTRVDVQGQDEVGELASAFNVMTENLHHAREELTGWSEKLEEKVVEKTDELARVQRQVVHMEKMASLGKLAATVAHEVNNPLSGILTYAKLVGRDIERSDVPLPEREELLRYLKLIQLESSRCGDIVKNLLSFAPFAARFEPQHLNPILERSLSLVSHHMQAAGIQPEVQPLPVEDDLIVCDSGKLEQALVALLVNAVEAMPKGGRVALRAEAIGRDEVRIDVADTGVGIPPDLLPRVFEPFFTTKETGTSAGLGLTVAHGIVEQHGGRIEVESEPGQTVFHLVLPRRPPAPGRKPVNGSGAAQETVAPMQGWMP
jgi:two-component system NtrC family sensor kinase